MALDVGALIREVYRQAALHSMPPPAVTRLVKLLYLSDLEWRRTHQGTPLTDLRWRFLHFGPYANELGEILGGPDVEIVELRSGRQARHFAFDAETLKEPMGLPEEVVSTVARLVKEWGDANLNQLLDYVYFDTEPMENAVRGEFLDFSNLRPPSRTVALTLDPKKIGALRARIRERTKALALSQDGIRVPAVNIEAEQAWDDEPPDVRMPRGKITAW